MGKNVTKG